MDVYAQTRTCILHVIEDEDRKESKARKGAKSSDIGLPTEVSEKVLPFNDFTFQKAQECAKIRMSFKRKSKYKDLASGFPSINQSEIGYHKNCYSNFTAIKKLQLPDDEEGTSSLHVVQALPSVDVCPVVKDRDTSHVNLRSDRNVMPSQRERGILEQKCIFCHRADKWTNKNRELLSQCFTKEFEKGVRLDARSLNDFSLLAAVGDRDFVASEVRYHNSCRKSYSRQAEQTKGTSTTIFRSTWHISRGVHKKAFQSLVDFIELNILKKEEIILLADIHKQYVALCQEKGLSDMSGFLAHHLEEKLKDRFPEEIVFDRSNVRQGVLIFKAGMVWDHAARLLYNQSLSELQPLNAIKEVAYLLRK